MKTDEGAAPSSEQKADRESGGWNVESASVAAGPTPADTTAETIEREAAPDGDEHDLEAADELAADDLLPGEEGERRTSAGAADRTEQPGKTAAGKGGKKKPSWQARVGTLTRNWRTEEENRKRVEQENQNLRTRLETLERGGTGRPADRPADGRSKPAEKAAELAPMPEPPSYLNFQTDEEYQAAMKTWRADVSTWQGERETRLKTEISGSLEARLSQRDQDAALEQHRQQFDSRLGQMREAHPDFTEHVEANSEVLDSIRSVFLQDLVVNTHEGGEFLYEMVSDPDLALTLGELPMPTRPMADAIKSSPAVRPLMRFFGTPEGRTIFNQLRRLPGPRVYAEVGKLEDRLVAADRGPARGARETITSAIPPAKPPVGTPRARQAQPTNSGAPSDNFEDWMKAEDRREAEERSASLRSAGIS